MAKQKIDSVTPEEAKSDREIRWAAHLEKYKIANPVKFAEKEARGEFAQIPPSFK